MADNVAITAGSGTTVSTEEVTTLNSAGVSAQHLQRIILAYRLSDGVGFDAPGDGTNGLDVDVTRLPALVAGTAFVGQVGVAASSSTTGTLIAAYTSFNATKQSIKTAAGNLYGYHIYNPNTTVIYVQMFAALTASVTLGTTAPTMVIAVPAGGWADSPTTAPGIAFSTGIVTAATTTATGSTGPTTNLLANFWYM